MVQAAPEQETEFTKLSQRLAGMDVEQKACVGSILGAFIGDSLGSFREFCRGDCPEELIEEALTMPGGGHWNLLPGQITDDSELAMCMLRGLLAGNGKLDIF